MKIVLSKKNHREIFKKVKANKPSNLSIKTAENFFSLPNFSSIFREIADFAIEKDINLEIYNIPLCFMLGYKRYFRFDKNQKFAKIEKCNFCRFAGECRGIAKNRIPILEPLINPIQREDFTDLEKCMLKILNIENGISTERVLELAKKIKICASCTSEGEVFRVADRLIERGLIKREFKDGKYIWSKA